MSDAAAEQTRTLRILRTAIVVFAIFLVAALLVWVLAEDDGGEGEATTTTTAPRILSAAELREAASVAAAPIYWAGERPGTELELSEEGEGRRTYVRYLTGAAEAGDPAAEYLTIATYRLPRALALLEADAKRSGGRLRQAPDGAFLWVDPERPTSVYVARPGEGVQVEVYDPDPRRALALARSAALAPLTP